MDHLASAPGHPPVEDRAQRRASLMIRKFHCVRSPVETCVQVMVQQVYRGHPRGLAVKLKVGLVAIIIEANNLSKRTVSLAAPNRWRHRCPGRTCIPQTDSEVRRFTVA